MLKSLGFPVSAWTRTPKPGAQVPIFHGDDRLELFLKHIAGREVGKLVLIGKTHQLSVPARTIQPDSMADLVSEHEPEAVGVDVAIR